MQQTQHVATSPKGGGSTCPQEAHGGRDILATYGIPSQGAPKLSGVESSCKFLLRRRGSLKKF